MRIFADFTGIFTTICLKHKISVIEIMFVPDIVSILRKCFYYQKKKKTFCNIIGLI